jgi:peptidoglycan/LPS O-acetylase OafA/YrhL
MTLLSPPRVEDRNGSDARQDRQQTTPAGHALAYRPALDGLRAVAIGMVILFHAGLSKASGGFIGVDIFFVLSGYLVTSMVLVQRAAGTLRLVDFYGRRARRLLPAALVVIAGVSLVWLVIASPVDRAPVAEDARWAALYLSNWHFADVSVDYFAAGGSPSPFLHFWSLSVEEQFYLAWPAIMVLVWRIRGRGRGNDRALGSLAVVAGVITAASLAMLASAVASGQHNLAHFGTHTRAYQLLFGALLAMLVQSHRWPAGLRRLGSGIQCASIGVLVLLASSIVDVDPSVRGLVAAVCTVGLLAALELHAAGAVGRALSLGPLVALGQISYATYLWHYPIIITIRRFAAIPPLHLAVATTLLSVALAMLSLRVLEMPIRTSRALSRRGAAVVVAGLACSLAVGLAAPVLLHSERRPVVRSTRTEVAAGAAAPRVDMTGLDAASSAPSSSPAAGTRQPDASCTQVPLADCIVVQGSGRRVLLLGDSHAGMLVGPLRSIAESEDMTLALAAGPGCPWQLDLVFTRSDQASCEQMKRTWYDTVIPQFDPDVIVVMSRATDHVIGSDYPVSGTDAGLAGLDQSQLLTQTSERTLRRLATGDRQLVVIEPLPVSPAHALGCLSGARYADECDFAADVEPSAAERTYRGFATTIAGVRTIDMDPWVCPRLPTCEAVISDVVVRKDHDHLTDRFAATLSARLDLALRDVGVL